MNLIRRLFPFRTCTLDIHEGRKAIERPCLLYHIKRCQAPCVGYISKADYRAEIAQIELFLEGRQEVVARELATQMQAASEATEYERAAALCATRSRPSSGRWSRRRWPPTRRPRRTRSVWPAQDTQAAVQLFAVRGGKMVGRDVFLLDAPRESDDATVLAASCSSTTARHAASRRSCSCPLSPTTRADLEGCSPARRGAAVHLHVPRRGDKRELLELAARNATETLAREHARWLADQGKTLAALEELADALDLPAAPLRIECYDISNFQGAQSVGSMVVLRGGPAADRRVPPLPDQGRRGRRTTSPATRRCCGAASCGPGRATRAARRSCAGSSPTWS